MNKQTVTINKIDDSAPTNVTVKESGVTSSSITVTASTLTIQFPINMLKSGLRLGNLTSIEFVNDIAPEGTDYIDVSEAQNGSIQLWGNGLNSYIGSTKKIYGNPDSSYLFTSTSTLVSSNLETINFNDYFDTSKVTNMSYMFGTASELTEIEGISELNTSNVTDMSYMFSNAYQLTSLDLSKWNTSKVTTMEGMFLFEELDHLTSLNVSNWNTSQVVNMADMFYGISSLTNLDLSKWNTSSLIAFGDMFDCCDKLNVSIKLNGIQWFEFTMQNYSFYGSRPPISITIYGDGTNESEILEMIN